MSFVARPVLGPYMSITNFRALRRGAEDTAGRGLVVTAGKECGHSLDVELKGVNPADEAEITSRLDAALGLEGTRFCLVKAVKKTSAGYDITIEECAGCYGLKSEHVMCTFALGLFIGVVEVITGRRCNGEELECTAAGHNHCVFQIEIIN